MFIQYAETSLYIPLHLKSEIGQYHSSSPFSQSLTPLHTASGGKHFLMSNPEDVLFKIPTCLFDDVQTISPSWQLPHFEADASGKDSGDAVHTCLHMGFGTS